MARRSLVPIFLLVALSGSLGAQSSQAPGPAIGEQVPDFSGLDQFGRPQTLRSVMGSAGAMLVFFRSADW